jgi:hypothetical protein
MTNRHDAPQPGRHTVFTARRSGSSGVGGGRSHQGGSRPGWSGRARRLQRQDPRRAHCVSELSGAPLLGRRSHLDPQRRGSCCVVAASAACAHGAAVGHTGATGSRCSGSGWGFSWACLPSADPRRGASVFAVRRAQHPAGRAGPEHLPGRDQSRESRHAAGAERRGREHGTPRSDPPAADLDLGVRGPGRAGGPGRPEDPPGSAMGPEAAPCGGRVLFARTPSAAACVGPALPQRRARGPGVAAR